MQIYHYPVAMETKDIIRAARERLGLTERQFAERVGVSRGSVQQLEKGATAPTRKNQPAVAALIGITTAELMHGHVISKPKTASGSPVSIEEALAVLGNALAPLDATARRRAVTLLADLADDPAGRKSLAAVLDAVIHSGKRMAA